MDLNRLPYLPIQFFYHQFTRHQKRLFVGLLVLLAFCAVGLVFSYTFPYAFSQQIETVSEVSSTSAELGTVEAYYHDFPVSFPVFFQKISYSAGPILPEISIFQAFLMIQLLFWSVLLTFSSQISSWPAFIFYGFYVLFIHFTGVGMAFFPEGGAVPWLVEIGFVGVVIGLAYLFQSGILSLNSGLRLLLFLIIHGGLAYFILVQENRLLAYEIMTNLYFYEIIIAAAFLIFVGKDLNNLVILIGTNRPEQNQRWPFALILAALLLTLIVSFFWLNEFFSFGLLGGFQLSIRPIHALALVSFFMVFTSQNQFLQVKGWFGSQWVYTGILIAWTGIVLSFISTGILTGDALFSYAVEHFLASTFFCVSAFYTFFILFNHRGLLHKRINLYYLLTQGREFGFMAVWLLALGAIVVLQGVDQLKTKTLLEHSYTIQLADQIWLQGDTKKAQNAYEFATKQASGSIKGNYNMAALIVSGSKNPISAIPYYEQATKALEFVPARLNAAQILALYGQYSSAEKVLKEGLEREEGQAEIANNLALIYESQSRPDSAIRYYKQALQAQPDQAIVSSNLALLYDKYGRGEDADNFMLLASETGVDIPAVQANVWARKLFLNQTLEEVMTTDGVGEDYYTTYHYQLATQGKDTLGQSLINRVAKEGKLPESLLWDGWMKTQTDSSEIGLSRLSYLALSSPKYAGEAYYQMALYFVEQNLPEIALEYFIQSENAGKTISGYYAALMQIKLGWKETARQKLSDVRAKDAAYLEPCSKEIALLLQAYGQNLYAQLEWDLSNLTFEEQLRIGIYADSLNQYINALEAFRTVTQNFPDAFEPYYELGKIYNRYRDSLAISNLELGIGFDSTSHELKLELARAYLWGGQYPQVEEILSALALDSSSVHYPLQQELVGYQSLVKGDTLLATQVWEELLVQFPTYEPVVTALSELYLQQNRNDAGSALIESTLSSNELNPTYWYYYAVFSKKWGYDEDAERGMQMAIELIPETEPKLREALKQKFDQQ